MGTIIGSKLAAPSSFHFHYTSLGAKSQLHGLILDISTILCGHRMRFAGHCWHEKQELLLWTPNHGARWVNRPATTYIDQLCYDTGWRPNDLLTLMQDHDVWCDRFMNVQASSDK